MCSPSCEPLISRAALRQWQYLFAPIPVSLASQTGLKSWHLVLRISACACLCAYVQMHMWKAESEPAARCQVRMFSSLTGEKTSHCTLGQLMFNFLTCRCHWMRRCAKPKPLHSTHSAAARWRSPDRQALASSPSACSGAGTAGKIGPNATSRGSGGRRTLFEKLLTLKILLDISK